MRIARSKWYARNGKARWRVARKPRRCSCRPERLQHLRCTNMVWADEQYFDTGVQDPYAPPHVNIALCKFCADELIEE